MITLFTRSPQPEMLYGWYLFDHPQICLSFGRRLYFPSPSFFHVPSARQTLLSGVFALCQFNGVTCHVVFMVTVFINNSAVEDGRHLVHREYVLISRF